MARTKEGIPIVTKETFEGYGHQLIQGKISVKNLLTLYDEMVIEQPELGRYVEESAESLSIDPYAVRFFATNLYTMIKRQAQIDDLKETPEI